MIKTSGERFQCDDMLLNREIDKETHQRMISKLKEEIAILRKKIDLQESSETCRFGIPLLSKKPLGSIFPQNCIFGKIVIEPPH